MLILQSCGKNQIAFCIKSARFIKGGKVKPTYDASDIAAINAKLDVLLGNKALPVVTLDTRLLGVTATG
jgi:hypothetical protein